MRTDLRSHQLLALLTIESLRSVAQLRISGDMVGTPYVSDRFARICLGHLLPVLPDSASELLILDIFLSPCHR